MSIKKVKKGKEIVFRNFEIEEIPDVQKWLEYFNNKDKGDRYTHHLKAFNPWDKEKDGFSDYSFYETEKKIVVTKDLGWEEVPNGKE